MGRDPGDEGFDAVLVLSRGFEPSFVSVFSWRRPCLLFAVLLVMRDLALRSGEKCVKSIEDSAKAEPEEGKRREPKSDIQGARSEEKCVRRLGA